MQRKVKYTDEPLGKLKVIKDFLPSPNELSLSLREKKGSKTKFLKVMKKVRDAKPSDKDKL